jgi:RNA polymerase sigma-70 factor (ECF subfamily)
MEANVERVIDEYSDMVYRIALTRTRIVENAEDIYQEVFLKYGEKRPKFKDSEHEKAWLIRVTINLTKNFYNSSWNKRVVTLDENLEFESFDETEVFSIVCNLPQNYRTVIYLMYYEGYKVKEIAKIMKKKEGTIKTWAFRARKILEENLKGEWSDE